MIQLIFASHNENKTAEIRAMLPNDVQLISLNEPRSVYILSGLIAFTWWMAFNPGFFSSDSFLVCDS